MDKVDFILGSMLVLTALSLLPFAGIQILQDNIYLNEKKYIQANLEFYKAKDPSDKSSEALYWHIQLLEHTKNR